MAWYAGFLRYAAASHNSLVCLEMELNGVSPKGIKYRSSTIMGNLFSLAKGGNVSALQFPLREFLRAGKEGRNFLDLMVKTYVYDDKGMPIILDCRDVPLQVPFPFDAHAVIVGPKRMRPYIEYAASHDRGVYVVPTRRHGIGEIIERADELGGKGLVGIVADPEQVVEVTQRNLPMLITGVSSDNGSQETIRKVAGMTDAGNSRFVVPPRRIDGNGSALDEIRALNSEILNRVEIRRF